MGLDSGLQNVWSSDYVQKNPNKAYKATYASEYAAVSAFLNGGPEPQWAGFSKLGKGLCELEVERRKATGPEPIPPEPTPVPSFDIPRWNTNLLAGPGPRIGWWRQYKTPANTLLDAGSGKTVPHICTPAPNPRYVSGPRSWEWWVLGSTTIPVGFPVDGRRFATINPHNSSYDVGNTGAGGIGWGFGSGVSPWHIFFSNGQAAPDAENDFTLYLDPSPSTNWSIVDNVIRARRYDFTLRVIWGRMDQQLGLAGPGVSGGGIGDHPNNGYGRVWVWVDGVLRRDTGNRDTLHRAVNPVDGKTYTMTSPHRVWDGAYAVPSLPSNITMERTASRVGRTLAEALVDGKNGFTLQSEWGEGGGSMTSLPPFKSSEFKAPVL